MDLFLVRSPTCRTQIGSNTDTNLDHMLVGKLKSKNHGKTIDFATEYAESRMTRIFLDQEIAGTI